LTVVTTKNSRLTILRDPPIDYPELWMNVYIAADNPYEESSIIQMFVRAHCWKADTPDEADLVIFGGGADVSPHLYGEEIMKDTHCSPSRDEEDIALYSECLEKGIAMFGICRGAQFLHVMNGGKLYQHVDKHTGDHRIWDNMKSYTLPKVSSVHHQSCIPNLPKMKIVASVAHSENRWVNNFVNAGAATVVGNNEDVEAFWYDDTAFFGVQGHPEYQGYQEFTSWYINKLSYFFHENKNIKLAGGNFRKVSPGSVPEEVLRNLEKMREQTNVVTLITPNAM